MLLNLQPFDVDPRYYEADQNTDANEPTPGLYV
jgi:hypothetical protein